MASERELLDSDVLEVRRILVENPSIFQSLADLTNLPEQTRRLVITDLVWQIWHLVMGANELLKEELRLPLVVVQRAVFEAITALSYLVRHPEA